MIKANELRIGNLVGHQDSDYANGDDDIHFVGTVYEIGERNVILSDPLTTGTRLAYAELIPIPLMQDWLHRAGYTFEIRGKEAGLYYNGLRLSLKFFRWDSTEHYLQVDSPFGSTTLRFVHQVQNWFFALTAEELTINEKV